MNAVNLNYKGRMVELNKKLYLEKIAKANANGCRLWLGWSFDGYGYFAVKIDGVWTRLGAHVIAYLLSGRKITSNNKGVLHECDVPLCCTEKHLWKGTQAENNADMDNKGRRVNLKGSKHANSKLTEENIPKIFALWKRGNSRASIARRFKVNAWTINDVVHRRTWKHVKIKNAS